MKCHYSYARPNCYFRLGGYQIFFTEIEQGVMHFGTGALSTFEQQKLVPNIEQMGMKYLELAQQSKEEDHGTITVVGF